MTIAHVTILTAGALVGAIISSEAFAAHTLGLVGLGVEEASPLSVAHRSRLLWIHTRTLDITIWTQEPLFAPTHCVSSLVVCHARALLVTTAHSAKYITLTLQ